MQLRETILLLTGCLTCACEPAGDAATYTRTILALGTIINVEIIGVDSSQAEQALDDVEALMRDIQRDWHAYGDGELGRANDALTRGESVTLSPDLAALVRRSLKLRELSDGFFDPAVGELVELWGFADDENTPVLPPDQREILDWRENQSVRNSLGIKGRTVSAAGPLKLDFGGIAKGTALAGAAKLLRENGIENAIIDAGGDLIVLGVRGTRNWRIGIRDPKSTGVLGAVVLAPGEAIVTSGDYERFFEVDEQRYHHLLDPHTGQPVSEAVSVTVVDLDPELADAAATALMAAGPQRFRHIAAKMGIECAMLVTSGGDILMTPRMAERLETGGTAHEAGNPAQRMNKTVNHGELGSASRV